MNPTVASRGSMTRMGTRLNSGSRPQSPKCLGSRTDSGARPIASADLHKPFVATTVFNSDLHVSFPNKALKLLSPLDEKNGVLVHQIIDGQRIELARCVDAIKVNVIERHLRAAVFVDQRKRRTGDSAGIGGTKAFGDSFHHRRLPCSQLAAKENDAPRLELGGKLPAEFGGLLGGMRDKGFHRWR